MTNDLNSLKQELLDYLVAEGFAIFRGQPDGLEGIEMVFWDTAALPNYQAYLNVAKIAGARIIVFSHREFQSSDLDEAVEQLQDCEFGREELRSMERTLADLRAFVGSTCTVEMAFDYEGRMYVYELSTEWFQMFMDLSDLLMAASSPNAEEDDEDESDGSFGGYYSKN